MMLQIEPASRPPDRPRLKPLKGSSTGRIEVSPEGRSGHDLFPNKPPKSPPATEGPPPGPSWFDATDNSPARRSVIPVFSAASPSDRYLLTRPCRPAPRPSLLQAHAICSTLPAPFSSRISPVHRHRRLPDCRLSASRCPGDTWCPGVNRLTRREIPDNFLSRLSAWKGGGLCSLGSGRTSPGRTPLRL
jgi:hypothetical protein